MNMNVVPLFARMMNQYFMKLNQRRLGCDGHVALLGNVFIKAWNT